MVYYLIIREVYFFCVVEFVNLKVVSVLYCGNWFVQVELIIIFFFM